MKLYNIFNVIDNKSVRAKERKFVKFNRTKGIYVPGRLIETNRGYFIEGKHVDMKAAETWMAINEGRILAIPHKEYNEDGSVKNIWVELTAPKAE